MFLSGAAHRNLLPVLSSASKPHTGFALSGVYFNFNLTLYFGALHLVNRAINLVATYITVRCTFVKPKMPIYEGQLLTPKGQRPVILVEQRQKCFYQVQRTEICCRFYQVHLNHTQALLYRAFILISTLRYSLLKLPNKNSPPTHRRCFVGTQTTPDKSAFRLRICVCCEYHLLSFHSSLFTFHFNIPNTLYLYPRTKNHHHQPCPMK